MGELGSQEACAVKGEGTCQASCEDNEEHPSHCIHARPRLRDYVCCFCGGLFEEDTSFVGRHGQYLPKRDRHLRSK